MKLSAARSIQVAIALGVLGVPMRQAVLAHPGGLAKDGCHNDRKNGGRHCHQGPRAAQPKQVQRTGGGSVYYENCTAARAAGATPVRRGDPGYASHLDRDNDGIGCE